MRPGRQGREAVAFLVVGSPLAATTHYDLILRARKRNVTVHIIPNASIMTAVSMCGLQLYSFGQPVSIPLFNGNWRPGSFIKRILDNMNRNLHTLCLLDLKVKEPDLDQLAQGRIVYLPERFMTASTAARQILEVVNRTAREKEEQQQQARSKRRPWWRIMGRYFRWAESPSTPAQSALAPTTVGPETRAVALARVGAGDMKIVSGTLAEIANLDLGPPLHSLVILAKELHPLEQEALLQFDIHGAGAL